MLNHTLPKEFFSLKRFLKIAVTLFEVPCSNPLRKLLTLSFWETPGQQYLITLSQKVLYVELDLGIMGKIEILDSSFILSLTE